MESTKGSRKREKKELTPRQKKVMNILNWVATAFCIVLVVFALVVAIFTISSTSDEEFRWPSFGKTVYMVVKTDSMSPTFDIDDMIVSKKYDYTTDGKLEIGQVITFRKYKDVFNTHRIVYRGIDDDGSYFYITRGDNQELPWQDAAEYIANNYSNYTVEDISKVLSNGGYDKSIAGSLDKEVRYESSVLATWGSSDGVNTTDGTVLKGVGTFTNWIQDEEEGRTRFFCVVVLPLILLFVVYAFVLVRTLVIAKLENERKVQSEQVVTVDSLSDEEKRRLAQEYLASLAQNSSSENVATDENVENDSSNIQDSDVINDSHIE